MDKAQTILLIIIAASVATFLWGRWRHDMVAMGALLACVALGLVPAAEAFSGFGHPAVITVACVLILSRALQSSGAVDGLTRAMIPSGGGPTFTIASLAALGAVLSAFMNNVGALALLMPVAMQVAAKQNLPPGRVLMPLAFGSILGGMTTLIGTPPNLIVSGFRAEAGKGSFAMFDFTPVGLAVAAGGLLFVALVGWRLVPARQRSGADGFDVGAYMTEVLIPEDSKVVGSTVREISDEMDEVDAQIVGMARNEFRVAAPNRGRVLAAGDILVIEAEPEALTTVLSKFELRLVADVPVEPVDMTAEPAESDKADGSGPGSTEKSGGPTSSEASGNGDSKRNSRKQDVGEVTLMELAVRPDATLVGRSAADLQLRTRFSINLLALSRQGERSIRRLRSQRFRAGDVLLI